MLEEARLEEARTGVGVATVLVEEARPASARASVVTLVNSSIGAGILALPWAFRMTGWAVGLALIWGVALLEGFTLYVLARYAEQHSVASYGQLVRKMLGRRVSLAMCAVMFLFLFGSCIAYLMIIGDSFAPLLQAGFGAAWWTGRAAAITGVGVACILPLTFKTRLGALAAASSAAVCCILVVVGAVMFRSIQIVRSPGHSWDGVRAANPSWDALGALSLVVLGFACHTNVISVFSELEQQPLLFPTPASLAAAAARDAALRQQRASGYESLPSPRSLRALSGSQRRLKSSKLVGMLSVVACSTGITALLYSATGLCGYLAFPTDAASDILLSFGEQDTLMQVARAAIGLVLIASYPVIHFPARAAVRELAQHAAGRSLEGSATFHAAEPLCYFGATLAVALLCHDLGAVFQLIGGTCGAVLVLTIPGCFLIQYAHSKQRESRAALAAAAREPLLPEGGGVAAAAATPGPAWLAGRAGRGYSMWGSKLFWAGVLLQLLSALLCGVTIATVVHPHA